jgi:hypothetical protein
MKDAEVIAAAERESRRTLADVGIDDESGASMDRLPSGTIKIDNGITRIASRSSSEST